ncbi:MAG: zinc ribbon domain-containing protein [Dehalococcoidia bacterium]|nr:zinc ribbon domain-containing protein [Dehalococcoidia bacterium]
MPIYEYKCKACDLKFEVRRGFSESSGANCPECQCQAQRIFSPVPIVFKGPGFYVTDNAREGGNGYNSSKGDGEKPAEKPSVSEPAKDKAGEKTSEAEAAKPKPAEVKA